MLTANPLSNTTKPVANTNAQPFSRPTNRPNAPTTPGNWAATGAQGINGGNPWLRNGAQASAAPAAPSAPGAPQQQSFQNPFASIFQSLFGSSSGGSSSAPSGPPSPFQQAMGYLGGGGMVGTTNPVTPGSAQNGGIGGPGMTGQLGAWQNNQNIYQTAQNYGRGDQMATSDYGSYGSPAAQQTQNNAFGQAMQYLGGGGMVGTTNPVTPGSAHNGGIGSPGQVAGLGAWQNGQNIAQTMQAFGWRGPQMATSDYAPGGALYRPPPAAPAPAPGTGTGGSPTPGGPAPGQAPVTTSIDPSGVYNRSQTQGLINQLAADQFMNADADYLMKQYQRPGMSRDAGTLSRVMPAIGEAEANVANIQAMQPMLDDLVNRQQLLAGQTAQGQEGIALANILAQLQQTQDAENLAPLQAMSPIYSALFGAQGRMLGSLLNS
jgi:hypothetical protein